MDTFIKHISTPSIWKSTCFHMNFSFVTYFYFSSFCSTHLHKYIVAILLSCQKQYGRQWPIFLLRIEIHKCREDFYVLVCYFMKKIVARWKMKYETTDRWKRCWFTQNFVVYSNTFFFLQKNEPYHTHLPYTSNEFEVSYYRCRHIWHAHIHSHMFECSSL